MTPRSRWRAGVSVFHLLLLLISIDDSESFNLDIHAPIYKYGPEGTYFGFSVAQHFKGDEPLILVGSPRGETGQKGTNRTGTVYACPLTTVYTEGRDQWCTMMRPEYKDPSKYRETPSEADSAVHELGKDFQLLGATVQAEGRQNGSALVCAPLTRFHKLGTRSQGVCYQLDNNLELNAQITTCETKGLEKTTRHNSYGQCNEGFSAHIDKEMIITGVIGARMWTGGVFARAIEHDIFETAKERYTMTKLSEEHGIRPTLQSHAYLGYSVNVGRFGFHLEGGSRLTIVSGATRHERKGAVIFLPFKNDKSRDNLLTFTEDKFMINGTEWGSNFGYAIAVLDLNNDGFDDLVVSAPFEHYKDKDGHFGGVVSVYFSQGAERGPSESKKVFHKPIKLRGPSYYSQFGLSLAPVGNIDGDKNGHQDFAVGAPFAFEGTGAVYIYHGASDVKSFRRKPAQVIRGSELPSVRAGRSMSAFGFSLSGGADLDKNGYPDIVVGSYKKDSVVVLRSRPVISINVAHKTATPYVDIEKGQGCPRGSTTCFNLDLSLKVEVSKETRTLVDFKNDVFVCNLEVLELSPGIGRRASIVSGQSLHNQSWPCGKNAHQHTQSYTQKIYIPDNSASKDWVNPLKFRFTVRILNDQKPSMPAEGQRIVDLNQYPILHKYGSTYEFEIPFNTRCGEDQVCQTDLELKATLADIPLVDGVFVSNVGEKDHLDIKFTVGNKKEKAYSASLYLTYDPEELELPQLIARDKSLILEMIDKKYVRVKLGNPMDSDKKHQFDVRFKLVRGRTEGIGRPLAFKAEVNSTSEEVKPENNKWEAQVKLIKKAELEIIGISDPPVIRYGGEIRGVSTIEMEEDIGVMVRHNYTVHNKGPWTVRNVIARFKWPWQVESKYSRGKYALYLLDVPTITTYNTDGTMDVRQCAVERPELVNEQDQIKRNTKDSTLVPEAPVSKMRKLKKRDAGAEPDQPSEQKAGLLGLLSDRIQPKKRNENGLDVDVVSISCAESTAKCFTVTCHFDFIDANSAPVIDFRARLWNSTFIEDYSDVEYVEISSWGGLEVDASQGIDDDPHNNVAQAFTQAYPDKPAIGDSRPISWFWIVFSILMGLLILFLVILCLWKCGFFKRERPETFRAERNRADIPEREKFLSSYEMR